MLKPKLSLATRELVTVQTYPQSMPFGILLSHQAARRLWYECECRYPMIRKHIIDGTVWKAGESHCERCGLQIYGQKNEA